jgi:Flp pilus assembly protein TadD
VSADGCVDNPSAGEELARGEARYRAGAYAEAAAIFAKLADDNPGSPAPIRLLGLCRLRLGETDKALALLAQAHALAPRDPYARLHYGIGLHAVGRHREAAELFAGCRADLPRARSGAAGTAARP